MTGRHYASRNASRAWQTLCDKLAADLARMLARPADAAVRVRDSSVPGAYKRLNDAMKGTGGGL